MNLAIGNPGKWICKTLQSLRTTHRWTASSLLQGVLAQCKSLLQGAEQNAFSLPIGRYQKDVQLHLPKPPGVICPLRKGVIEGDKKNGKCYPNGSPSTCKLQEYKESSTLTPSQGRHPPEKCILIIRTRTENTKVGFIWCCV